MDNAYDKLVISVGKPDSSVCCLSCNNWMTISEIVVSEIRSSIIYSCSLCGSKVRIFDDD